MMELKQPYYAVIFTNTRTVEDNEGYARMAEEMEKLARNQPGFVDFESVRDGLGISISYWDSLEAIARWKQKTEHLLAQQKGKELWYSWYKIRVCRVDREYEFRRP